MKNKKLNLFLGIVIAVCAIVAIFGFFGDAFADIDDVNAGRGAVYSLMFSFKKHNYNVMPSLIAAFVCVVTATVTALLASFLPGKLATLNFAITAILLIAVGVICLFGKNIFLSAGTVSGATDLDSSKLGLGVGFILPAVFAFIGGALSAYGTYTSLKA